MRHVSRFVFYRFTSAILVSAAAMAAFAEVPKIKAADLVCNGESFFAASNICSELTRLARADGVISQGESFRQVAVSGAPLASIIDQYKNCNPKPVYLVSDGAGIDLMGSSDMKGLGDKLMQYLEEMRKGGTKKLLWMIYPDPQSPMGSAQLKQGQDLWAEEVPKIMKDVTDPEVTLVDLRETWAGKYSQYTSDGIHCTNAGGTATAEAFWEAMKADDWAFFDTSSDTIPTTVLSSGTVFTAAPVPVVARVAGSSAPVLTLSVENPSEIAIRLTTVSGRTILSAARRRIDGSGLQPVTVPLGGVARGMYCCEVRTGHRIHQSKVIVP